MAGSNTELQDKLIDQGLQKDLLGKQVFAYRDIVQFLISDIQAAAALLRKAGYGKTADKLLEPYKDLFDNETEIEEIARSLRSFTRRKE